MGSGPFNQVAKFSTQDYVLGKNPHYWMKGAPNIPCLEYVQASSNDAALAQIQSGQVDWTHNFVPNVESAYEAKDKAHYHAFYATTAFAQSLVFDDTQYPYSLPVFRKAVSLAIDRKSVSKLGEYGYAPPTDALGLTGIFPTWYTPALKARRQAAAAYDPNKAKQMLTAAGFTYKGSQLIDPKGNPVTLDIHVISGWSDWVASDQIIAKNLSAIGINSSEALEPDWNSWYPSASTTKFPTLLWQNARGHLAVRLPQRATSRSRSTRRRVRTAPTTSNWEHFYDPSSQATLNNWRSSLDPKQQQADFVKLATLFLKNQPIVPVFIGPRWSTYSTKYFHGFTSPKNYYARPDLHHQPGQHPLLHPHCPWGQGRRLKRPDTCGGRRHDTSARRGV